MNPHLPFGAGAPLRRAPRRADSTPGPGQIIRSESGPTVNELLVDQFAVRPRPQLDVARGQELDPRRLGQREVIAPQVDERIDGQEEAKCADGHRRGPAYALIPICEQRSRAFSADNIWSAAATSMAAVRTLGSGELSLPTTIDVAPGIVGSWPRRR